MKTAPKITLTDEQSRTLKIWLRLPTSTRLVARAKIILAAAEGRTNLEIASRLRVSVKTVSLWRRRFVAGGLVGIEKEASRSGRKSTAAQKMAGLILRKTKNERPTHAERWTTRSLARELGISPSTVQRVWKANGLSELDIRPH